MQGQFDIIGDIHGCHAELVRLLRTLGYEVADPHRVHECVFAVLALESEPVDPRL